VRGHGETKLAARASFYKNIVPCPSSHQCTDKAVIDIRQNIPLFADTALPGSPTFEIVLQDDKDCMQGGSTK